MNALIVAEQLRRRVPGGIGTYVRGLTRGLGGVPDVRPTLWASRPPRRGDDAVAALGPTMTSPIPGRALVLAWDRGFVRPPGGFDVVHATSLAVPPAGGSPMTVMVHDLAWRRLPDAYPPRGRRWHEAALARALRRATAFVTPSDQGAEDLVAAGAPASAVSVIAEGCDHLPPADHDGAHALLANLGVGGEYLLTVSTLEPRKNLPRLLAAYGQARPRLPEPWPLVVAGPAGWGPELPREPGVILAGPVVGAVLNALYARARLVAYVPLFEGFGLPAVEAMYACVPVVASPMPSTGGAALEVDPTDVGAIADALVTGAGDERTRTGLVTAGVIRAGELRWDRTAARHAELWRALT